MKENGRQAAKLRSVTHRGERLGKMDGIVSLNRLQAHGKWRCLKKHVDFFGIGSNDLTQYTTAAGRENPMVSEYFIDDHPAVLRLIELVVRAEGSGQRR